MLYQIIIPTFATKEDNIKDSEFRYSSMWISEFFFILSVKNYDNTLNNSIMAYMSQEGYDKLVAEIHRLEAIERPKASAAIAEAADKGDLSENSEYDAAKEAQAHLEAKIVELKRTIAQAKIVDTSRLSTEEVQIMSTVELTNLSTNK